MMHEPFDLETPRGLVFAPAAVVMMAASAATVLAGTVTLGGALGALGLVRRTWGHGHSEPVTIGPAGSDEHLAVPA